MVIAARLLNRVFDGILFGGMFLAFALAMQFGYREMLKASPFKDWREAKIFVFEDIVVYTSVLLANFVYDPFINFISSRFGIGQQQPYSFGLGQFIVSFTFGLLLLRKIDQWKCYS